MQAYSNNLVDHHLILDLLPFLARAYFARRLPAPMSYGQAAILVSLGLQQRDVSECEKALNLPASQILALFNKVRQLQHRDCDTEISANMCLGIAHSVHKRCGEWVCSSVAAYSTWKGEAQESIGFDCHWKTPSPAYFDSGRGISAQAVGTLYGRCVLQLRGH